MSEQWIEWGVRRTWGPSEGDVAFLERDYRTARKCAKDWPGVLVHRVVTAGDWRDGDKVEHTPHPRATPAGTDSADGAESER